jgi:CubicO group peptidase (beta-lactamase class C family)
MSSICKSLGGALSGTVTVGFSVFAMGRTYPDGVEAAPGVAEVIDEAFNRPEELGTTHAVVAVQHGEVVAERYGGVLEHWDRPAEPVGPTSQLLSWSMAKSMLHAVVGMLVGDGLLDLSAPADVPLWRAAPDDPRAAITLQQLLEMRDGLDFNEDYVDGSVSHVIEMLFGSGASDVAGFAADRPPAAPPGSRFNYSSGTTNIVSGIVARLLGSGDGYRAFLHERLFAPIGMHSADPGFDPAGTWIASSFVHATARHFARFGLLYLHDGVWEGRRLLPEGWVEHGTSVRSVEPDTGNLYGAHWWVVDDGLGTFWAAGYEGQSIMVTPALDLVTVRLGRTPAELGDHLPDWRARLIASF